MRTIKHLLDQELNSFGHKLVLVPLDYNDPPTYCTLFEEDYNELMDNNWPEHWYLVHREKTAVVWSNILRNAVYVSRLITKAGPGEQVKYLDKDHYNLRRTNLILSPHGTPKRREADYINPNKPERTYKHVWEYNPNINYWRQGLDKIETETMFNRPGYYDLAGQQRLKDKQEDNYFQRRINFGI